MKLSSVAVASPHVTTPGNSPMERIAARLCFGVVLRVEWSSTGDGGWRDEPAPIKGLFRAYDAALAEALGLPRYVSTSAYETDYDIEQILSEA